MSKADLQEALGAKPSAAVSRLDDSTLKMLADAIQATAEHESDLLEESKDKVVRAVPLPLRPVVKALLP